MRKLFKCRKALSPVVAAIILIAVTVAVSIAVAAWMGALTFTFMKTEEVSFTGYTWSSASPSTYIDLTVKNTGSSALTISEVRVSDVATSNNVTGTTSATLDAGESVCIRVTKTFTSGVKYEFTMITAKGNTFGPYIKTAP
jgi:flagellin-like protein